MTSAEKVAQLRALLCDTLLPLINNDYIFLDIPYYSNPGDTLIWEGTECLLKHRNDGDCHELSVGYGIA